MAELSLRGRPNNMEDCNAIITSLQALPESSSGVQLSTVKAQASRSHLSVVFAQIKAVFCSPRGHNLKHNGHETHTHI